MKPVRLPAAATLSLPRWSILALCLLYILPGLIGRDPWKGMDASGFGIMWTMANGSLEDWLWPHIVGLPSADEGPLAFWLGALSIQLFGGWFGDVFAARIATSVAFVISAIAVWYATYLLGRRQEAQPLKLPFGGQPDPLNFGRTLADGALLMYLASLGLLLPSHTTSTVPLCMALIAYTLYLTVRLFDTPQKITAIQLGLILGLLVLTKGWVLVLGIFITINLIALYRKQYIFLSIWGISLPFIIAIVSAWLYALYIVQPYESSPYRMWMEWNYRQIGIREWAELWANCLHLLKYSIWSAWPAWPFAIWAIFAWRKQEKTLHISLPLLFLLCFIVLALLNKNREDTALLPLIPPLAIMAAFGLPTLKRGAINAVDWFAVTVLTAGAGLIWLGYIAVQTGWPHQLNQKILTWSPDFKPESHALVLIAALTITAIWFRIVYWRISRQPSVLWRSVVLSSGGVLLCWMLLMTLWLPFINHRITYANTAKDMANAIPFPYRCIDSKLKASQRASFAYFSKVHFANFEEQNCDLLLTQSNRRTHNKLNLTQHLDKDFPGTWELIWEGGRASDNDEYFRLYRKK